MPCDKCPKCGSSDLLTIGEQQACKAENCNWHTDGFEKLLPLTRWQAEFIAGAQRDVRIALQMGDDAMKGCADKCTTVFRVSFRRH